MFWKEFPQSVTKLLRNLWKCRINLLEWLINKAFTVTNGEIAPAYVKSDSFTGNDLQTILFPKDISLSFKDLQFYFPKAGNGFVTCYLLCLASN